MFVVRCKAIKTVTPSTQTVWPIIDSSFMQGKLPYDELITKQKESQWFPTCYNQVQTLNALVECGPYTPKYANLPDSTWNLPYIYTFYFKWGGQNITDQLIQDPKAQEKYPVPNHLLQTIQVADPRKQHTENILKTWDFRRGYLTSSAIKRIQENLQLDDSEQSDTETPQEKEERSPSEPPSDQNQEAEEIQTCPPLTLRKRFLPRRGGQPQAAHLQAVPATAKAQTQPHQLPNVPKKETETPATTSRTTLTRFKKGFEWDTECELAAGI